MPLVTSGHLNVVVRQIDTEITLRSMRDGLSAALYQPAQVPGAGWSGFDVNAEDEEPPEVMTLSPVRPTMIEIDGMQALLARYIRDVPDERVWARRKLLDKADRAGFSSRALYRRTADDVLLLAGNPDEPVHTAIVSTHDDESVALVSDALRSASGSDVLSIGAAPKGLKPPDDFYLWLLGRWTFSPQLTADTSVIDYRSLSAVSRDGGGLRVLDGLDITRGEVAISVVAGHVLGPGKYQIRDNVSGVEVDIFHLLDGTFSIHRGRSRLLKGPVGPATFGVTAAVAAATRVVPAVVRAFSRDRAWLRDRARLLAKAKAVVSGFTA